MPGTHIEEVFRILGLHQGRGAQLLRALFYGEITIDSLTDNQIEYIEDDWSSRNYVSIEIADSCNSIRPIDIEGESDEEFKLRHIKAMVKLLHDF